MKRILCALLVATLPFGSVLADAPKEKNAKVTLVYQHELPNVPGKSIKGVLVEYGPGGFSDLLDILSLRALLELLGLTGEANGITDVAYWMPYPTHLGHRRIRRATGAFLRDWVHRRPFRPSRSAGRRADLGVRIQIEHPGLDQLRAWERLPTRRRASADRRVLLPGRCLRADGLRSFGGIEGLLGSGHSTGGRRGTGRRSDLSRLLTAGRRSTNRPARPR